MSGPLSGYGGIEELDNGEGRDRRTRRRKLAGYLKAANDIRQSYTQSYSDKWGASNHGEDEDTLGIPGAFPDVAIVSHGDEQLILFPSYACRHRKGSTRSPIATDGPGDAEYWTRQWQKHEDDRAIVDVDVRGWMYTPHRGPMSRKKRLLIGLARQLSGIPAPRPPSNGPSRDTSPDGLRARHREHEAEREQQKIELEAEQILRKGQGEEEIASRGAYSENTKFSADNASIDSDKGSIDSPDYPPEPGSLSSRSSWNQPSNMSQAELLTANAHLMARIKPFLTNPLVANPITLFFYDENQSVSRTIMTDEAGHFTMRAALEFVPTHVRVLASEDLSATEAVKITEPEGVSLITDVDDTIKHSSIGSGAREIFRNTFIRDLGDLTIDGVKEWYNTMYEMGVGIHYVSNSPWQLFPVLASFLRKAGLPPGSYHLKQYSGMLQGIFEPVAERKKVTLDKLMHDFPERKFILIGDSGEADLEVYTDVVQANPRKIIAVFIRDVTTPKVQGFFDSAMGPLDDDRLRRESLSRTYSRDSNRSHNSDSEETRPVLPPRVASETKPPIRGGPRMGTLINFDRRSEQTHIPESRSHAMPQSAADSENSIVCREALPDAASGGAPPRPSKPISLRGVSTTVTSPNTANCRASPPPLPKRLTLAKPSANHPLSQTQSSSDLTSSKSGTYMASAKSKVSSAYNALPEIRSHLPYVAPPLPVRRSVSNVNTSVESALPLPPPPRRSIARPQAPPDKYQSESKISDSSSDEGYKDPNIPVNKKLDLWKRRWIRAKHILEGQGVVLRAWRVGEDVSNEAIQLVEKTMAEMRAEGNSAGSKKIGDGGKQKVNHDLNR